MKRRFGIVLHGALSSDRTPTEHTKTHMPILEAIVQILDSKSRSARKRRASQLEILKSHSRPAQAYHFKLARAWIAARTQSLLLAGMRNL